MENKIEIIDKTLIQLKEKLDTYFSQIKENINHYDDNQIEKINQSEEIILKDFNEFVKWKNTQLEISKNERNNLQISKEIVEEKKIYTKITEILSLNEIDQLEHEIGLSMEWILFDTQSESDHWKMNESTFLYSIRTEADIVLLITTENGKTFGVSYTGKVYTGTTYLKDIKAFFFTFENETLKTYPSQKKDNIIYVNKNEDDILFTLLNDTIVIKKEEQRTNCLYTSNETIQSFSVSRIVAIKMKSIKYPTPQLLNCESIGIRKEYQKTLEYWTHKQFRSILFDSTTDDWGMATSTFNDQIVTKTNVLFYIEDEDDNIFGYYHSSSIKNKFMEWSPTNTTSFVYSLQSNGKKEHKMKYELIKSNCGCEIYPSRHPMLISLAFSIVIYKKEMKENSYCLQHNTYVNFHGKENALCGKVSPTGYDDEFCFIPKRIIVIDLK